jgi:hypothetical protein
MVMMQRIMTETMEKLFQMTISPSTRTGMMMAQTQNNHVKIQQLPPDANAQEAIVV